MTQHRPAPGRVAGVDYGTKRIGVAITDPARTFASPLAQYNRGDKTQDARYFQRLAREENVALFVVGLPIHLSGEESQKSHEARQFAAWLGETTGKPVELFDERFTTAQAEEALLAGELTNKRRKARRDMLAAQFLLAAYLEASRGRDVQAESLED
ncbi:MAG: Holliday junction resolvase RuvX [Planctomycetales bacterium]|nr:Holliday junction resolvase RuvX [Planctomycetales bacterium]